MNKASQLSLLNDTPSWSHVAIFNITLYIKGTTVHEKKTGKRSWKEGTQAKEQLPMETLLLYEVNLSQEMAWKSGTYLISSGQQGVKLEEKAWGAILLGLSTPQACSHSLCTMRNIVWKRVWRQKRTSEEAWRSRKCSLSRSGGCST